jgi:hypothetical protein
MRRWGDLVLLGLGMVVCKFAKFAEFAIYGRRERKRGAGVGKGVAAQSEGKACAVGALVLTAFFVRRSAPFAGRRRRCFGLG